MNKQVLGGFGVVALVALAGLLSSTRSIAQQAPPGNSAEPFKVFLPQSAPPVTPPNPLTMPGLQNSPPLPQGFPSQPGSQPKAGPKGFPDPMNDLLQAPGKTAGNGFVQQGPLTEKQSALLEYLKQDFDAPDINVDIAINPKCGPFAICVQSYTGKDASQMARELALELRNNPAYKLNAFVSRQNVEECKAEQARIREYIDKVVDTLNKGQPAPGTKVNIPVARIEIGYVVLIGGYKNIEAASDDLKRIAKLPPPDPRKVKLHTQFAGNAAGKGAEQQGHYAAINPFKKAFAVPNPTVATTKATGISAEDLELFKKLNAKEQYSLLKCPKNYTLKVKQYAVPAVIESSKAPTSFFDKFAFSKSSDKPDAASVSANSLAKLLREAKFESYVLHTSYVSYVTVGSYDSPDDPRIPRDQELLPQLNAQLQAPAKLLPRPEVMAVPR